MPTYTYLITTIAADDLLTVLNQEGGNGWELIEQRRLSGRSLRLLFKKTTPDRAPFFNPMLGMPYKPIPHNPADDMLATDPYAAMLDKIPGADDYDTWVQMGAALWHQYAGEQGGLDAWHQWSKTASNYDPAALNEKWKTFAAHDLVERENDAIDMLIFCPYCHRQHIDAPNPAMGWDNRPHKSHLCAYCRAIFRTADVPTNGVREIHTRGEHDCPPAPAEPL